MKLKQDVTVDNIYVNGNFAISDGFVELCNN